MRSTSRSAETGSKASDRRPQGLGRAVLRCEDALALIAIRHQVADADEVVDGQAEAEEASRTSTWPRSFTEDSDGFIQPKISSTVRALALLDGWRVVLCHRAERFVVSGHVQESPARRAKPRQSRRRRGCWRPASVA